jgi:outer membrane protein OmpA-like peptidoglycan-associated protein
VKAEPQAKAKAAPAIAPVPHGLLQRKCACGGTPGPDGECAECKRKRLGLQRKAAGPGEPLAVPPIVHEVLRSPGRPLDGETRADMESRFGHDFSRVRVHTDGPAAESARAVDALAYTVGRNVVFAAGRYSPATREGRSILGHELTHVLQQRQATVEAGSEIEIGESAGSEREADRVSSALLGRGEGVPAVGGPRGAAPALMRLTLTQFRRQLGSTPEQRLTLDNVFANPTFAALVSYMASCAATPTQDLGPLALAVTPGLTIGGAERFGGYSGFARKLEINPTKREHVSNPAELADTLVHEFIHAVDDLQADCVAAGSPAAPLAGSATATPPSRRSVAGTAREARLMKDLGPGASNPCDEFIDINSAAQQMIVQILQGTIQTTGIGRPTLTFVNEILRSDPTAMTAYETCRRPACALATSSAREAAIASCSTEIIGRFMPARLQTSLLPAQVQFDFGSLTLRPDIVEKIRVIALFLIATGNSVELEGHTDSVGSAAANLILGQRRAEAVERELLRQGVPAGQIRSVTSAGESRTIFSGPAEQFRDRRVEIRL